MHHHWNCQMNLGVSLWFYFVKVESVTSVLDKNAAKAFIHRTKIYCVVTKLYEVFNRLQAFLYFLLWGIKVGIERKHIFHSWVADQSTAFLLAHGSHLNV